MDRQADNLKIIDGIQVDRPNININFNSNISTGHMTLAKIKIKSSARNSQERKHEERGSKLSTTRDHERPRDRLYPHQPRRQ